MERLSHDGHRNVHENQPQEEIELKSGNVDDVERQRDQETEYRDPSPRPRAQRVVRFQSVDDRKKSGADNDSGNVDSETDGQPWQSSQRLWTGSDEIPNMSLQEPSDLLQRPEQRRGDYTGQMRGTGTVRERWRNASMLVRQGTARLKERLDRPVGEGDGLDAPALPEHLYPEEEIPLTGTASKTDEEQPAQSRPTANSEANRLVRTLGLTHGQRARYRKPQKTYLRSGQSTPEGLPDAGSVHGSLTSIPGGGGILSQLLKLQVSQADASRDSFYSIDSSGDETPFSSGASTPVGPGAEPSGTPSAVVEPTSGTSTPKKEKIKWYKKSNHSSTASLIEASMNLSRVSLPTSSDVISGQQSPRDGKKKKKRKRRLEDEIRVTVHIAEIIARQRYIMQLCRALMRYGAPTHRLEEYMTMTAKVLEVDGQFLYLPGCMIMSFDDPTTRTAEVKLVRTVQGVDLGRLADTHNVYKNVVHDLIGVEEAIQELDVIMNREPRVNKWLRVLLYGFASVAVGPFAFEARPIDMPIIFVLGCMVGLMQHVVSPASALYSNVFEVTAAVMTSFLARAFGSIQITVNGEKQYLFCFSAIAQSSIALILPGFLVLCSSLELQSHQMIAGSIRMVYAIIYSLFLGYGITVGTTIYGLIDHNATSQTSCSGLSVYGNSYVQHFVFVAIFAAFLALINQAKWKQTPVMIFIAEVGYIGNYFSTQQFGSTSEVGNTIGAFIIGVLGNLYSRLWHGHAAAAILPGIFVLVPSGLASSNSLIAGLQYSNEVRHNLTGNATLITQAQDSLSSLGFGMIQVAIGISVGLFIAALVVYPFGKRRSGLFSF